MGPRAFFGSLLTAVVLLSVSWGADVPEQKLPSAKRGSFSGKMKLSEALGRLARLSGVVVEDRRGEPDVDIQIELRDVTFWQALDAIADAADARVDLYARDGRLRLVKRPARRDPVGRMRAVSYDGFFRTAIKRITATGDLDTGTTSYTAVLEVAWEPQLLPFYLETRPQNLVVRDDKLEEVSGPGVGSSLAPVDGRPALQFETPLPALPRDAKKISGMEGKLSVIAPSRMLTFTFDALDELEKAQKAGNPPQLKQDGVSCKLSDVKLTKDRWTIEVTLKYPPGNTKLDSNQSWVVNNELALESKDGRRRLASAGYVLQSSSSQGAVISYHFVDNPRDKAFRGKPQDWKLSYRTPASVVTIPLTFSFKDLPLP